MAIKTSAGGASSSTKAQFKQDVGFQKDMNKSVAASKPTLATGGGEPIEKGHKRTTEHRVLQPRDPETGHFDYNSSANMSRKYDYHAERNGSHNGKGGGGVYKTVPYFARGVEASFATVGVEKGDVISVNGQKYISTIDMTADEFRAQLENYLEDKNGGTHLGNDANWMKLGGRNDGNTGAAQAGDNREGSLDHFKKAVAARAAAYKADPEGRKLSPRFAADDGKAMKRFASRFAKPSASTAPKTTATPTTTPSTTPTAPKTPTVSATPSVSKPVTSAATAATTPAAPKSTTSSKFGNVSDAKSHPGKYLSENRELVNKMISSLKANGVDATDEQVVLAISESSPEELEELATEMGL